MNEEREPLEALREREATKRSRHETIGYFVIGGVIVAVVAIIVLSILNGVNTSNSKTAELGKECVSSGGQWIQNASGNYECRRGVE